VQPLYGFGNKDPARFVRAAGHPDVFYVEDRELSVDQVIEAPLPPCPVDINVMVHWLAVNGAQPDIPENAPLDPRRGKRPRAEEGRALGQANVPPSLLRADDRPAPQAKAAGKGKDAPAEDVQIRVPVKHEVSRENQVYLQRVKAILEGVARAPPSSGKADGDGSNHEATLAAERERRGLVRGLFASLASDPGLQQLVPYLRSYITEKVAESLKDLSMLSVLLKATRCLLSNNHIGFEQYLDKLMPAVLTCLVAQRLGGKDGRLANHWQLRREAADLTAMICRRFGESYPNLQSRVTKQLHSALINPRRPMSTQYGAVVGLAALGPRVTQLLVLPHTAQLLRRLDKPLSSGPGDHARIEAHHLQGAIQEAVGLCLRHRVLNAVRDAQLLPQSPAAVPPRNRDDASTRGKVEDGAAWAEGMKGAAGASLCEFWREGSSLKEHFERIHAEFGDAMLPFVPTAPVACLFI